MDAMLENTIRQEQLETYGNLMAGLAHDMKNHLSIIRESNGLMDDILAMGTMCEDAKMVERLQKSIDVIERRVVIAATTMHHLSGFGHRPDTPNASFLINDLIEEEYIFLERFSRLRQIDVGFELGEALPAVYNDPVLFQHVFYRVYVICLEQMKNGGHLTISTVQEETNTVLSFRFCKTPQMDFKKLWENTFQGAMEKLGGRLEVDDKENNTIEIKLTIRSLVV